MKIKLVFQNTEEGGGERKIWKEFESSVRRIQPTPTDKEGQVLSNLSVGQTFCLNTEDSVIFSPISMLGGMVIELDTHDCLSQRSGKRLNEITIEVTKFQFPDQQPEIGLGRDENLNKMLENGWNQK